MVLTLDGLKRMKAAKLEDIKNCASLDDCIDQAVDICRRKVSKKNFMRRVMRKAKWILKKADSESYIYDCMWCSLKISQLCNDNMLIRVRVANETMFDYVVVAPKYTKLSKDVQSVTLDRCFEVLKKAFIDAGFEIKDPFIRNGLHSELEPYGSFYFVF